MISLSPTPLYFFIQSTQSPSQIVQHVLGRIILELGGCYGSLTYASGHDLQIIFFTLILNSSVHILKKNVIHISRKKKILSGLRKLKILTKVMDVDLSSFFFQVWATQERIVHVKLISSMKKVWAGFPRLQEIVVLIAYSQNL